MNDDEMESDDDEVVKEEGIIKTEEVDGDDFRNSLLSPEDAKRQGELSEGVKKIKVYLTTFFTDDQFIIAWLLILLPIEIPIFEFVTFH